MQKHTKILVEYINNQNIFYINPIPSVCDMNKCSAVIEGKLIYADGSPHFNVNGEKILSDLWRDKFPKISSKN